MPNLFNNPKFKNNKKKVKNTLLRITIRSITCCREKIRNVKA